MVEVDVNINNNEYEVETVNQDPEIEVEVSTSRIIGEITPELYGAFVKILSFLAQGQGSEDIIFINNGKLNTKKSIGTIYSDLSELFGNNSIELIDPNNAVKLMSLIKGGDKVVFIEDENTYIVSVFDEDKLLRSIKLAKPDVAPEEIITKPEVGEKLFEINIDVSKIEDAINAQKILDIQYFKLEFDENFELVSIATQNDEFKEIFKEANSDTKIYKVYDLGLISKPDEYKLKIHKNNETIWFNAQNNLGLVEIDYFEQIDELNEFDSFIL
jgi:hypothetical protein